MMELFFTYLELFFLRSCSVHTVVNTVYSCSLVQLYTTVLVGSRAPRPVGHGPSQGAGTNLHVGNGKIKKRKFRRSPVSPDRNPRDPGYLVKPCGPTTRVSGEHENRHAGPTTSCSPQHAKIKKWFLLYCSYTLC